MPHPHPFGLSTLELADEIESDFYHLKAQEWACEPHEARDHIEAALRSVRKNFIERRNPFGTTRET